VVYVVSVVISFNCRILVDIRCLHSRWKVRLRRHAAAVVVGIAVSSSSSS
jgi:hypothetical protein